MIVTIYKPKRVKNIKEYKGETTMKALRKRLYMLTQDELMEQIKRECRAEGVPFKVDNYGNIWSIRFENKPIFVSHADTVIGNDLNYRNPLLEKDGKLSRPGFVLGADDRAGVNLILNHKHKINWIITKDEEVGCIGAKALGEVSEFISDVKRAGFFIELDRRGNSDILGNVHGYCEQGVVDLLQTVLPNYKDCSGVFTDIDAWTNIRQGVNLSIGYYNAHSKNEYLNIAEWEYLDSKIEELGQLDCTGLQNTYEKPRRRYSYGNRSWTYSQFDYAWDTADGDKACDFCGCYEKIMYDYKGYTVCEHCSVGIPEEELYEIESGYTEPVKKDSVIGSLNDEELSRCSNCKTTILPGEAYITVPDWEVCFCFECIEVKEMSWK